MITYVKDPIARLDYSVDWSDWLVEGDLIASTDVTVGLGLTEDPATAVTTDRRGVVVWLSGGTLGSKYLVAVRVTTDQGRIDERTFAVQVRDR